MQLLSSLYVLLFIVCKCTGNVIFYVLPNNSSNVSCPSQPCATLSQYLLDNNGTLPVVSNVEYHFLPGEHLVTSMMVMRNMSNALLIGSPLSLTMLSCHSKVSFIGIFYSYNVTIKNLAFNQCKPDVKRISYNHHSNITSLFFKSCRFCKMESTTLFGYGIIGHNLIENCSLRNITIHLNSKCFPIVAIFLIYSRDLLSHPPDSIVLSSIMISRDVTQVLSACQQRDNSVAVGILLYRFYNFTIVLTDSSLIGMNETVIQVTTFPDQQFNNTLHIKSCLFTSGQTVIKGITSSYNMFVLLSNCTFGYSFASIVSVELINDDFNKMPQLCSPTNIVVQDTRFFFNVGMLINITAPTVTLCKANFILRNVSIDQIYVDEGDVLHVSKVNVYLEGPVLMSRNKAKSIASFESCDVIFNKIVFSNNDCDQVISLHSQVSYIMVMETGHINFVDNTANNQLITIDNNYIDPYPYCLFQYVALERTSQHLQFPYEILVSSNTDIRHDNHAVSTLSYYTWHCRWIPTSVFYYEYRPGAVNRKIILTDQQGLNKHIFVCYQSPNDTSCLCEVDELGTVFPGQRLQVQLCLSEEFEHNLGQDTYFLYADTHNTNLPKTACKIAHQSQIVNEFNNKSKMFNFTVLSNFQFYEIFMTISPTMPPYLYKPYDSFYVNLSPCPIGFTLINGACDCDTSLLNNSVITINACYIEEATITRPANTWITAHYYSNSTKYLISHSCPMDYCLPHSSHLNLLNPDLQCQFNRTGILCSQCQHSLSMVFGSSRCIHCTNIHILITIIVILAGIVLVVLLYLLNLTATNGTINGIIFYANIISINDSVFLVNDNVCKPLRVFISFANLDLGIETCFYNGMDGYAKVFLQLFFPFYLVVIAASIIVASRYSSRILRWTYTRSLPVLATLFLLSYTSVLKVVLRVLFSYSTITQLPSSHQQLVWSIDASIPLFGLKFTILFITCLVLFLLLIPFNIILLFTRYLSQFRILNQFKPLLDAFQGSYKDKYYYWVGVHLIFRSICFALYGFQVKSRLVLSAVLLIIFSILNGCIYPNRKKPVNIQELLLLLNLTIMYAVSYQGSGSVFSTVTNVMISLAFTQFCTIVFYHFLTYTCHCNVVTTLQNVKEKLIKIFKRNNAPVNNVINTALLNIPERDFNYKEYQDGLVSDDFKF